MVDQFGRWYPDYPGQQPMQDAATVWAVIDETMATLKLMEPRLYAGVLRKLNK